MFRLWWWTLAAAPQIWLWKRANQRDERTLSIRTINKLGGLRSISDVLRAPTVAGCAHPEIQINAFSEAATISQICRLCGKNFYQGVEKKLHLYHKKQIFVHSVKAQSWGSYLERSESPQPTTQPSRNLCYHMIPPYEFPMNTLNQYIYSQKFPNYQRILNVWEITRLLR